MNRSSFSKKKSRKKILITLDAEPSEPALILDHAIKRIRQEITKNHSELADNTQSETVRYNLYFAVARLLCE